MSKATKIISIDGPAGAGKSSTARQVAKELGYAFMDTGAMYRAATWRALDQGIDLDDVQALEDSTRSMDLSIQESPTGQVVLVDGNDVSKAIRSQEVTRNIYRLDQISGVRRLLVEIQRQFGEQHPTVAEGRDIGTVVFPKAACKIYMDASIEERAKRRAAEMEEQGTKVDLEQMKEIEARDEGSRTRKDSPLRPADDSIHIDTSGKTFEAVVNEVVTLAKELL